MEDYHAPYVVHGGLLIEKNPPSPPFSKGELGGD
jgi:hypothetical protein